jgi:hypothetical protein
MRKQSIAKLARTYKPVGMQHMCWPALQSMRSTPLSVARRAQGQQPVHDVSDSRFHHFWIVSILCQRAIAFDHCDQKACGVSGFYVAANAPVGLALSQNGGNSLAPGIEDYRQPFPESRVKRRHFLRQIVQLAAATYILGPNWYTLNSAN